MTEIVYSVEQNEDIFDRFAECTAHVSAGITVLVFGTIGVLFLGFIGLAFFADSYYDIPAQVDAARKHGGLGLLIGFFGFAAISYYLNVRQDKILRDSATYFGLMHVSIDEYGIVTKSNHADCIYRWGAVHSVTSMETGIGINMFGTSFIALPNECLPDGLGHDDTVARINRWRGA